jgi:membrane protease YdiL (CAAX protease family)
MALGLGAVLVLFFLLATVIILPVTVATHEEAPEALAAQAISVAVWDGFMILVVYYIVRKSGGSWRSLGMRSPHPRPDGRPWSTRSFLGFIAGAYFTSITAVVIYNAAINALGLDDLLPSQQLPDAYFDHDWLVAMIGFSVVVAAPVAEEIFFRGFIFAGLRRRMPFVAAGLISGVLFSLAHTDPGLILPFTLVGLVLAFAYERTGSLYAAIGVHFIFNALSFLALLLVPGARN